MRTRVHRCSNARGELAADQASPPQNPLPLPGARGRPLTPVTRVRTSLDRADMQSRRRRRVLLRPRKMLSTAPDVRGDVFVNDSLLLPMHERLALRRHDRPRQLPDSGRQRRVLGGRIVACRGMAAWVGSSCGASGASGSAPSNTPETAANSTKVAELANHTQSS